MRILYSLPHPADRLDSDEAGHTVRARALLAGLERQGHEVIRVQAAGDARTKAAVGLYRGLVRRAVPRRLALGLRDFARVANSRRYALQVAETAKRCKPDLILETHIAFSLAGRLASQRTGVPLVLDDVTPSWEEAEQYSVGSPRLAAWTHRAVTRHARLCVTVSEPLRRFLIEEGVPAGKIAIVNNGIDDTVLTRGVGGAEARQRLCIPAAAVVIVYVGSFQPYHRVDLLLDAVSRLKTEGPLRLLIVGGGQRLADAQAQAERLGIATRVHFTGSVPHDQVAPHIAAGDIAVMAATNRYANPMKVYEYMALGKAIAAPARETIEEILSDRETALLFAPDDTAALTAALQTLIDDAELRARLGNAARQAAPKHTWSRRAEALAHAITTRLVQADRKSSSGP